MLSGVSSVVMSDNKVGRQRRRRCRYTPSSSSGRRGRYPSQSNTMPPSLLPPRSYINADGSESQRAFWKQNLQTSASTFSLTRFLEANTNKNQRNNTPNSTTRTQHPPVFWLFAMVARVELYVSLQVPELILRAAGVQFSWEIVSPR